MDDQTYRYYQGLVRSLDYAKMRALRFFSSREDTTVAILTSQLDRLAMMSVNLEHVRMLETLTANQQLSAEVAWILFTQVTALNNSTIQALAAATRIKTLHPAHYWSIIKTLASLPNSGKWAAKAFFQINSLDSHTALWGLQTISGLHASQHRALEQSFNLVDLSEAEAIFIITAIAALSESDAATIRTLFSAEELPAAVGIFWLTHYFSSPATKRDQAYQNLAAAHRAQLLTAFFNDADYLIWKINKLHAVTDQYGREIRTSTLINSSAEQLLALFAQLHPGAIAQYQNSFQRHLQTAQRILAVTVLKQATSMTRRLVARELSSATIYILLARGSELYDSSFREILVPVLVRRIQQHHRGALLDFLQKTDPHNHFVADFVISCAQKGKLTTFLPENPPAQKAILDLTAASAFTDEHSLILFSATFYTLLEKLQPAARSYLISLLIAHADHGRGVFTLQIRVILQYYLQHFSHYLAAADTSQIRQFLAGYEVLDLSAYTKADFSRWKADKKLVSLSIFQDDDDGAASFRSYLSHLISNGYQPRLSQTFKLLGTESSAQKAAALLVATEKRRPGSALTKLFRLAVEAPVVIAWVKTVNGYELIHNVSVYHNELTQQKIWRIFFTARIEMFAQRGHAYWRQEQLLAPLRSLDQAGEIDTADIQAVTRFLSIGSCGGIRAYSALNTLFRNQVDILATVGTGKARINNPYNQQLFEIIARAPETIGWDEIARQSSDIFERGNGEDYLQPGSLPSILHKMMDFRTDI